jgi:hypothetical protein
MSDSKSVFSVPEGAIVGVPQASPSDPNFRYEGQRVDGEKTPDAALRARRAAITTVAQYAAWLMGRGGVDFSKLTQADLEAGFARYRGEAVVETAALSPVRETRTISAGSACAHVLKKLK